MKPTKKIAIQHPRSRDNGGVWRRAVVVCVSATAILLTGFAAGRLASSETAGLSAAQAPSATGELPESRSSPSAAATVQQLLEMPPDDLERLDPLEVDLAVARSIPGCESLDVDRYGCTLDEWAQHIRRETDRYLHHFREDPAQYKNSLAYFKALAMVTVVGQDFQVGYHVESIVLVQPELESPRIKVTDYLSPFGGASDSGVLDLSRCGREMSPCLRITGGHPLDPRPALLVRL